MVEIALFDTDPEEQFELDDMLSAIMFSRDEFNITFYSSYTLFTTDIAQGRRHFDILFVNVATADNAGLAAAESARRFSRTIEIVLIAADYNLLRLGYRVKAMNYILKPYNKTQLVETIDRYYEFFEHEDYFSFKCGTVLEKIKLDNILYFLSNGRKLILMAHGNREYEFYGKLDDAEEILSQKGFIRAHQSYLVNFRTVRGMGKDKLFLENDEEIPVSRNRIEEIRNLFKDNDLS